MNSRNTREKGRSLSRVMIDTTQLILEMAGSTSLCVANIVQVTHITTLILLTPMCCSVVIVVAIKSTHI